MISDHDLCLAAQTGDTQAADQLVRRHARLAYSIARHYYLPGADNDDVDQVCLIALYQACIGYQPDRKVAFPAFARIVISRKIGQAVTAANRAKRAPLTRSIRTTTSQDDDGTQLDILDTLPDPRADTPSLADDRQTIATIVGSLHLLSPLELTSLRMVASGHTYSAIAHQEGRNAKSIDNACQRARIKLRDLLDAA